jgi:hypothetical protein
MRVCSKELTESVLFLIKLGVLFEEQKFIGFRSFRDYTESNLCVRKLENAKFIKENPFIL